MKKSRLLTAICVWIGMSQSAIAALVGINDPGMAFLGAAQDDFNITRDTAANLEWLDWSLTLDRSYDDVFNETQGGNLDGWRYATADEFIVLASAAGIPDTFYNAIPGGTDPGFVILNSFLGSSPNVGESIALSATSGSPGTHSIGGFNANQNFFNVPTEDLFWYNNLFPDHDDHASLGHALVRSPVVPIPAAVWLFGSGLLGLVGMARRRNAA